MTITSSGVTLTWYVLAAFLLFDLLLFTGYAWFRHRAVQLQRAHALDDYFGMLQVVQDIHTVLDDIRTNTEKK
jgi:hypothetical protein